jgi:hypothetical protein
MKVLSILVKRTADGSKNSECSQHGTPGPADLPEGQEEKL